ncbi:MAG: hypothetical protein ACK5FE_01020 [Cyanobacteriota bacterium]|jgi:glycosyltransferase involved in cell wall biosynthesis
MKRILIVMAQPPGSSGVQAFVYSKLLPFLEQEGWEFHFAGPDPEKISVLTEVIDYPLQRLHYTDCVSRSKHYSILKNRQSKGSVAYFYYAALQLFHRLLEKGLKRDPFVALRQGLVREMLAAEQRWDFDLIAGKCPEFRILEVGASVARMAGKPFVALYDDPHGHRDLEGFYPAEPERQRMALAQACGAIFMSPMTRERYIHCGLADAHTSYTMMDSYPENPGFYRSSEGERCAEATGRPLRLVHLGNLSEWRPVDSFLEAIQRFRSASQGVDLRVDVYGYLYPEAKKMIQSNPLLVDCFSFQQAVGHGQSHLVAEDSDVMLILIGPRHIDNQPSKFFDYLGHDRPILAIGPQGNPIEEIIHRYGLGVYCQIDDPQSILQGMQELIFSYDQYKQNFVLNRQALEVYSSRRVAALLARTLDQIHHHALEAVPLKG